MIGSLALKFKFFDWCLDTLFSQLETNLISGPNKIAVGQFYSKIVTRDWDGGPLEIFLNCTIESVFSMHLMGEDVEVIAFRRGESSSIIRQTTRSCTFEP